MRKKNCRSKQTARIMFWFHISELSTCISVRCLFTFRTDHRFRIYAHYLKWRLQLNEFISKVGVGAGRNKSRTQKYFLATITCFPFLFASLVFFISGLLQKTFTLIRWTPSHLTSEYIPVHRKANYKSFCRSNGQSKSILNWFLPLSKL